MRHHTSFRLSEPAHRKLTELAEVYGNLTCVVELAIDRLYQERKAPMHTTRYQYKETAKCQACGAEIIINHEEGVDYVPICYNHLPSYQRCTGDRSQCCPHCGGELAWPRWDVTIN